MTLKRRPLQASETFLTELKNLQCRIRKETGLNPSFRELTDDFVKNDMFNELEKRILKKKDNPNLNFTIRFDKR